MNPYIITDKDITNMLTMSTLDRHGIDLFMEVNSVSLTEHIFNCMCVYLYNYKDLDEYDKDVNTYLRVYQRFNAAGYEEAAGAGAGRFSYTAMSVTLPEDGSFCNYSLSFFDDVHEVLESHYSLDIDGGQTTLTSDTVFQKVQAIVDATVFVIEQIERAVFGMYTKGTTVFALLGMCEGNLSIQVYTP